MTQTLPKGAQRVADRAGVASVHVEGACAFGGRQYVAYAAPGYWFPAVECGTVIASTVRELADYARPELIPAGMPTPSGCAPADAPTPRTLAESQAVAGLAAVRAARAARRSPVLPGEHAAPVLPVHGDRAPALPVLPGDPGYAAACYALPIKPAPLRKAATLRALAARVTSPAFAAELIARADHLQAIADGVPLADRVTQRAYDHAPLRD